MDFVICIIIGAIIGCLIPVKPKNKKEEDLESIVKEFGLDVNNKDNRAWREIIQIQTAEDK